MEKRNLLVFVSANDVKTRTFERELYEEKKKIVVFKDDNFAIIRN